MREAAKAEREAATTDRNSDNKSIRINKYLNTTFFDNSTNHNITVLANPTAAASHIGCGNIAEKSHVTSPSSGEKQLNPTK